MDSAELMVEFGAKLAYGLIVRSAEPSNAISLEAVRAAREQANKDAPK